MALDPLFLQLMQVYRDAYQTLLKRLTDQEIRGLSQSHTRALIDDIEQIVRQLRQYHSDWLNHVVPLAYQEGSDAAVEKLSQRYGMADINVSFGGVHRDAISVIIRDTFQSVAAATEFMADNLKEAIRQAAKEVYQIGVVTGETRRGMTAQLVKKLNLEKGFTAYYDSKGKYIPLREYADSLLSEQWVGFVDAAGRRWDLENYVEMLTRTKVTEAVSRGTENRLTSNGLDLVIITAHGAEDWCRFYENRIFSISGKSTEYPPLSEAPNGGTPFHPRCVVGGVLVTGPRPIMSFSRWFEGEVVVIRTSSGNELTVTPNHPILTPKGWVAAGLLNEGDQVIRYLGHQGMMDTIDPDYVDVPTMIEEVANSLGHASGMSPRSVPVAAEDFHGDGKGSDVCIIRADSLLRNEGNATIYKPTSNNFFGFANIFTIMLSAHSMVQELVHRLFSAARSFIGGSRQSGTFQSGEASQSGFHGFRSVGSSFDSEFSQSSLDSTFINSKRFGNVFLSFPGLIAIKDLLVTNRKFFKRMGGFRISQRNIEFDKSSAERGFANPEDFSKGLQAFSGQITFDTIVHIDRRTFSGHVYNLQTKYNWYACNTIITHNCKHREAPIVEKFESEEVLNYGKGLDKQYLGLNTEKGYADQAKLRKLENSSETRKDGHKKHFDAGSLKGKVALPGVPDEAYDNVIDSFSEALDHGLNTNTECLLTLDAKTGDMLYNKISGESRSVTFPDKLVQLLANADDNSIIIVHNHPGSSCFSVDDLQNFKFGSLKSLGVVGHNRTIYYITRQGEIADLSIEKMVRDYQYSYAKDFEYYREKVISGEMTNDEAWREQSHKILEYVAKQNNFLYRRWLPDEQ